MASDIVRRSRREAPAGFEPAFEAVCGFGRGERWNAKACTFAHAMFGENPKPVGNRHSGATPRCPFLNAQVTTRSRAK